MTFDAVFTLQRHNLDPDKPTCGEWLDENMQHLCYTLERPWLNNAPMVSCIFAGAYSVGPNPGTKPWRLQNVPGRTQVDIHAGNTIADSEGCILVGMDQHGYTLLNSVDAVNFLKQTLPATFTLNIINPGE